MKLVTAKRNFKRDGEIYGLSEKDGTPIYQIRFDKWEEAEEWYYGDEYDFRTRRFINLGKSRDLEEDGLPTWEAEEYYKAMY